MQNIVITLCKALSEKHRVDPDNGKYGAWNGMIRPTGTAAPCLEAMCETFKQKNHLAALDQRGE